MGPFGGIEQSIFCLLFCVNTFTFAISSECHVNGNCTGPQWNLAFIQESSINYLSISDNSSISEIYGNPHHRPSRLTSNVRDREVYWTANNNGEPVIYSSSIKGKLKNSPTVLVNTGIYHPQGISYDWIAANIYFIDGNTSQIVVCPRYSRSGSNTHTRCSVLFKEQSGGTPYDISVDPNEGVMFWSVNKLSPQIKKAKMDGTLAVSLVTTDIHSPMAVCVDGSRVYWTDSQKNTIESINYDGSERKVVTSAYNGWGIGVLGDFLYWPYSEENEEVLKGVNIHNGANTTEVLFGNLAGRVSNMRDLAIMNISTQPITRKNSCHEKGCSQFCVLSGPDDATCICPVGMMGDGTSIGTGCKVDTVKPTIFVAQGSTLLSMQLDTIGTDVFEEIYIPTNVQSIDALVYNPLDNSVIFYDGNLKKIYNFKHKTNEMELLVEKDIFNVVSLDIDLLSHNLFFLDAETNQVELFSLRTRSRMVVYKNIKNANQVVNDLGTIYVSNTGTTGKQEIRAIFLEDPVKDKLVKRFEVAHSPVQITCDRITHKLVTMSSNGSNVAIESGRNTFNLEINGGRIDAIAKIKNRLVFHDQTNELKVLTIGEDILDDKYLLDSIPINHVLMSNKTKKHIAVNPGSEYMKEFLSSFRYHICSDDDYNVCPHICIPNKKNDNNEACWCQAGFEVKLDDTGYRTTECIKANSSGIDAYNQILEATDFAERFTVEADGNGAAGNWFWVSMAFSLVILLLFGVIGYMVWHFRKTRPFPMVVKPFFRKHEDENENENVIELF